MSVPTSEQVLKKSDIESVLKRSGWKTNSGLFYSLCNRCSINLCSLSIKWHPSVQDFVVIAEIHNKKLNELSNFIYDYENKPHKKLRNVDCYDGYNLSLSTHLRGINSCMLFNSTLSMGLDESSAADQFDRITGGSEALCNQNDTLEKLEIIYDRPGIYKKPSIYLALLLKKFGKVKCLMDEKNEFGEPFWDPGLRRYLLDRGY